MKKEIYFGLLTMFIILGFVATGSASSHIIVDSPNFDLQLVEHPIRDGFINETDTVRVTYYSNQLDETITHNLEGTDRYEKCKASNSLLYVGDVLSFDCTAYVSYNDYIEKKIQENIDFRLQPPLTDDEIKIQELEMEIQLIKNCASDSRDFPEYQTCIGLI